MAVRGDGWPLEVARKASNADTVRILGARSVDGCAEKDGRGELISEEGGV
jgi:hypothetical protein